MTNDSKPGRTSSGGTQPSRGDENPSASRSKAPRSKSQSSKPQSSKPQSSKGSDSDPEWRQTQEERIALIEDRAREKDRRLSLAQDLGRSAGGASNFDPGAPSRFGKLRVLARFLLLASYLLLGLVFAGIGVTVWLWREGAIEGAGIFSLAIVGWLLIGGFVYALFKFLGELAWLLADFGDHQLDARNLLIDLRDDLQRNWRAKGARSKE